MPFGPSYRPLSFALHELIAKCTLHVTEAFKCHRSFAMALAGRTQLSTKAGEGLDELHVSREEGRSTGFLHTAVASREGW
jgi:hypothetical protein